MGAFLRFFLIFFLILLALRYLARLLFPILMKWFVKKYGGSFDFQNPNKYKKDGEVSIDDSQVKKNSRFSDKGDYIDYEETK